MTKLPSKLSESTWLLPYEYVTFFKRYFSPPSETKLFLAHEIHQKLEENLLTQLDKVISDHKTKE